MSYTEFGLSKRQFDELVEKILCDRSLAFMFVGKIQRYGSIESGLNDLLLISDLEYEHSLETGDELDPHHEKIVELRYSVFNANPRVKQKTSDISDKPEQKSALDLPEVDRFLLNPRS